MSRIYVSYRREDAAAAAEALRGRLAAVFGPEAVVSGGPMGPGMNPPASIAAWVGQCAAMVLVIGPRWLASAEGSGRSPLENPYDVARLEIEAAQRAELPILPVLVEGARIPPLESLPPGLGDFALGGGTKLRPGADFEGDAQRLIGVLARWVPPRPVVAPYAPGLPAGRAFAAPGRRKRSLPLPLVAGTIIVLAAVVASAVLLVAQSGGPGTTRIDTSHLYIERIVAVPNSDELWAVGADGEDCAILHYAGGGWSKVACPYGHALNDISMDSPTDGWAIGGDAAYGCALLHYSGGRWTLLGCPFSDLTHIVMASATEGWAYGGKTLAHYSGGRWSAYDGAPSDFHLQQAVMVSTREGWGISVDSVYHLRDGVWAKEGALTGDAYDENYYNAITMLPGGQEGWVVGNNGLILHYIRGQWAAQQTPSGAMLLGVAMVSAKDGWAVGGELGATTGGVLLHYTGTIWSAAGEPVPYGVTQVATLPDGEAWAFAFGSDTNPHAALLHYRNGNWSVY